ncbi:sigma-70 family RNA polymerase sigma factor [Fulvivirga sp. 29W222]|uniref:Sigma-70 family RNA polymerase sigma factor n=1 Tax=Fulvivirga marina TaxID=2494733 RepID=A0A937FXS7_9BACT|nr:sigma-70 family RNA polymerase sigma factor [Fulvivirga marina]MBL6446962.1 sigma-70 family RNA polymerase sigma factor [Fulvivirga marina]
MEKVDIKSVWIDLQGELFRFISRKIQDSATAQDILQDVFIKVYLHVEQLNDGHRLTSWVYQITRNTISDYYKKRPEISGLKNDNWPEEEKEDDLYSSLSNCINSKIASFSQADRDVMLLTYFKGYSQKDLATFLDMSYSGTKNKVQRLRSKLKDSILNCEHVEADSTGNVINYQKNNI